MLCACVRVLAWCAHTHRGTGRPPNSLEESKGGTNCLQAYPDGQTIAIAVRVLVWASHVVVCTTCGCNTPPRVAICGQGGETGASDRAYSYDRVFPSYTSQAAMYEHVARPLLSSVLNGINGAIIAYGQTGSGKTFTMQVRRLVSRGRMVAMLMLVVCVCVFSRDPMIATTLTCVVSHHACLRTCLTS